MRSSHSTKQTEVQQDHTHLCEAGDGAVGRDSGTIDECSRTESKVNGVSDVCMRGVV